MTPRQSILLKILLPLIVFITLWLILRPTARNITDQSPSRTVAALTPQELRDLGIDGDTPADTVATLVGQMKQYRRELQSIQSNNESQQAREKQLKAQQNTLASQLRDDMRKQQDQMRDELLKSQQGLLDKLDRVAQKHPGDIPPGLGLAPGEQPAGVQPETRWLEPLDAPPVIDDKLLRLPVKPAEKPQPKPDVKVYTLPQNATLTGSVAMTALIGRVPLNGTVSDPYPFKLLIGEDNLTANGIELPDVAGAVVSGIASGDWTLSCVRGQITSLTFVFHDGTIRTVPQMGKSSNKQQEIGWLSDEQGLPCIPGERKSNAKEYLTSQFLLAGSGAAAEAFANGESTTVVEGGSITSAVTGNSGQYVLGQAIGGGLKETADWMKQHYGQMFDAVYVPPGHKVAVHLSESLSIDYEPEGRQVKYQHATASGGLE
ncbi:TIGR03752 family integrating conjugative element protein [Kosakonia sp. MUSA4]|uniref:TIGR03752 family integrating conjugative element protein n=1 Tax=Kosakonia sp. MUSA4 TaxID=2067958 RepID=UPI00159AB899|nr:TIGR03752 family integrating conjugative element protein [Kosakonia sp. MUSA4]QJT79297.1 TIGR03752 family integrating conjugative element protein [Kosakonia sp. MUSA4]